MLPLNSQVLVMLNYRMPIVHWHTIQYSCIHMWDFFLNGKTVFVWIKKNSSMRRLEIAKWANDLQWWGLAGPSLQASYLTLSPNTTSDHWGNIGANETMLNSAVCFAFLSFPFERENRWEGERAGGRQKRNVEINTKIEYKWKQWGDGEISLEFAKTLWLLIMYAYNDTMPEYPTSVTKGLSPLPVPCYLHPFYSMVFCLFYRYIYFSLVGQKLKKKKNT